MKKISQHFSREEFQCKGQDKGVCSCGHDTVDAELITVLEDVRVHFGAPVTIHSGNRCEKYNKHIKGSLRSQHLRSRAADITVEGVAPMTVWLYLTDKYQDKYGIGRYSNFTHIDTRNNKARWAN